MYVLLELFAAINASDEPRDSFTAIIASNCRLILADASFATIYRIFAKLSRAKKSDDTGASRHRNNRWEKLYLPTVI